MSVYHVIAFKLSDPAHLPRLTSEFLALEQKVTRNGKPIFKSIKGGKQISTEAYHHDMQVVFVVEFANHDDMAYYIDRAKEHDEFKMMARNELGAAGFIAMDFEDQDFPK